MKHFFALFAGFAFSLASADPGTAIGKIDSVAPGGPQSVTVIRGGSTLKVGYGQPVQAGDIVKTAKRQSVSIEFTGGSYLVVGEEGEAALDSTFSRHDDTKARVDLRRGVAFLHVDGSYRNQHYFLVSLPNGVLAAEVGDFDLRARGPTATVYSISAAVTAASSLKDLSNARKAMLVSDGNFAKLGFGATSPDTFTKERLFSFEAEDEAFGKTVQALRASRFPLPVASASTEGSPEVNKPGFHTTPGVAAGAAPVPSNGFVGGAGSPNSGAAGAAAAPGGGAAGGGVPSLSVSAGPAAAVGAGVGSGGGSPARVGGGGAHGW